MAADITFYDINKLNGRKCQAIYFFPHEERDLAVDCTITGHKVWIDHVPSTINVKIMVKPVSLEACENDHEIYNELVEDGVDPEDVFLVETKGL